jgi:DNA repair protein RecN (Recombination protein N)
MAGSTFTARLKPGIVDYEQATVSGVDSLDFVLMHGPASTDRGGLLENVASSGEKARIMLAMECELPGSAGAMCTNSPSEDRQLPPITVLYDEIDAHVGGRAAVSMAHMLATQKGQQVISITHSPSVAAVADTHIVVQKHPSTDSQQAQVPVSVNKLDEDQRRQELARMASGDLAPEEALKLADALLRDTLNHARSA